MDIEKKGALKNILRGLFVSERQGDVVSSVSLRDVSTLFGKSYDYEEVIEKPVVEEVTGVSRNTVQSRYSKIGKSKRLEKLANDILKTLLDIRTFENNKRDYEDALRNYHSIVEARRHKEIMEVFQKEISTDKIKVEKKEDKPSKSLLVGGLALGAVALLLPLKSFAKEIEDELNEKDLNKQLEDLSAEINENELQKQFSEFDELPDEIPEEESVDEELKLDDDIEKATSEIEKLQTDIDKVEIQAKEETDVSRAGSAAGTAVAGSAAGTAVAGSAIGISSVTNIAAPLPSNEKIATDTSRASNRQVTPLTSVSEDLSSTNVSGGLDEDRRMSVTSPTEVIGTSRVSNIAAPLPPNEKIEYGTDIAGSATGISTATNRQVLATTEIGSAQSVSRNRVGFARLRPDESAVMEVSPSVIFGGFPYKPNLVEEKPSATRVSSLESIDELKRKIGRAEGGERIGYNAINVPVIKNRDAYDKKTRGKIYDQLFDEAKIFKGNIDVTTGKKFEKNLSEMTMQEVIDLGKRRLEHYKSFKFDGKPVDLAVSSAAGQFGYTMAAIEDNASKLFGVNWKKETFSQENQEKMQTFLMKSNIIRFEKQNLPVSEAFLYMKHFFGPYSEKPLRIVNAKDTEKMSDIMSDAQKKSNPIQAAMTVKQYKDHLIEKGFSFDPIDTKKLITEEDRKVINLKPQTTTTDVPVQRNTGQRVISSSTENRDVKRQSKTKPVIIVQNNNNTVINNRNSVNNVSALRQQNNNPNMRQ